MKPKVKLPPPIPNTKKRITSMKELLIEKFAWICITTIIIAMILCKTFVEYEKIMATIETAKITHR